MSSVKLSDTLYYGIHPTVVLPEYHVDYYIGLTEEKEIPVFECPDNATFHIPDRSAVTVTKLKEIVEYINSLTGVVYIYCKDGHGRSGMVAAAVYGKREGLGGKKALAHIKKEWKKQRDLEKIRPAIRKLGSPQTKAQKAVVEEYLDTPDIIIMGDLRIIHFYESTGKYGPFTNFYKIKEPLLINGEEFIDTEQYYQVMKFRGLNASERMLEYSNLIKEADSPMKTKMLGHQKKNMRFGTRWKVNKKTDDRLVNDMIEEYKDVRYRSDWNVAGVAVMLNGLYHKFTQFPNLKKLLTDIQDNTYIVEHTTRDKIWADGGDGGTGKVGQNRLGKLLTALSFVIKHGDCEKMLPELKKRIKIIF
jgi:predicted NAD-dependent protein-ADP-ribosyltransferase YbiA (DUF1768 family)